MTPRPRRAQEARYCCVDGARIESAWRTVLLSNGRESLYCAPHYLALHRERLAIRALRRAGKAEQ